MRRSNENFAASNLNSAPNPIVLTYYISPCHSNTSPWMKKKIKKNIFSSYITIDVKIDSCDVRDKIIEIPSPKSSMCTVNKFLVNDIAIGCRWEDASQPLKS